MYVCLFARISEKPEVQISRQRNTLCTSSFVDYVTSSRDMILAHWLHIMKPTDQNQRRDAYVSPSSLGGGTGAKLLSTIAGLLLLL